MSSKNLADAQEILHQLGVPRIEKEPEFSQLPNDLIMKIIRMADGGRNTHKKKIAEVLKVIQYCRDQAEHKAREECSCWTPEHGWVSTYSDSDESDSEDEGSDFYWEVWNDCFWDWVRWCHVGDPLN